jgi:CheY-like chemotaxis protein
MRILLADDSPVVRKAVAHLLVARGHEVEEAADGVEAITLVLTRPPDAVLLDLHMPRVTGWVVCRLMKEDPALCRIPVLVLTGYDDPEDRFWAEQSGADGYLSKGQVGQVLLDRLDALLAGRALSELSGVVELPAPNGPVDVLARVCEVLDRKLFEATVVNEVTAVALRSLDLREALGEVLIAVGRAIGYDVGGVALLSERTLTVRCARLVSTVALDGFAAEATRALGEMSGTGLTPGDLRVSCIRPGAMAVIEDGPTGEWGSWHFAPLQARGRVIGVLALAAVARGRFDDRVQRTLRALAPAAALVIEGAREFHRVISAEAGAGLAAL